MVFIILTRSGWDKLFSRLVKDCDAVWLNNGVLSESEVFRLREAGWDLTVWTSRLTDLTSEIETVREHYPNQVILTEAAAAKIFAAFDAPSCMRSLIATLALLSLAGCSDEVTTRFATLADAKAHHAFQRGWLPPILPDSATSIVERNNLDLNTGTGSFDYDLSERAAYIKRLTEAGGALSCGREKRCPHSHQKRFALGDSVAPSFGRRRVESSTRMMKAILPLISLLCTGCSTLLTINSGEPYSGVKCNIEGIRKTFDASTPYSLMPHCAEGIFSTIDLPLSVAGDTILLPYAFLNKDRPHGVETPQLRQRRGREFPETGENRL